MVKKRASLKGKGVSGSGSSQEKGKGIDLLFGGPPKDEAEPEEDDLIIDASSEMAGAGTRSVSTAPDPGDAVPPPPPPPPTFAAASLSEASSAEGSLDDFGLPVAMEAPPPDLELAVSDIDTMPVAKEAPPPDLALNLSDFVDTPVAMEAPPPDLEPAGSVDIDSMPVAMEGPPPDLQPTLPPTDFSPPPAPVPTVDFPDTLSEADIMNGGDNGAFPPPAETDFSGLAGMDFSAIPPQPEIVSPPPISSPPITPPPASPPFPTSPPVDFSPPPPPVPSIAPPRARIDSISGIASEKIEVVEKDILPEDTKFSGGPVGNVLAIADRAQVERNELITQRVTRYIGRERRENLDKQIESLYDEVAKELSDNKTDTEFALRYLSQAQDIIFEDVRQYDEALYRVKTVQTMIARKQNLRRWSYTWGAAVFFYAVVWLAAFIAGFMFTGVIGGSIDSLVGSVSDSVRAVQAAWFSALAGGVGGVSGVLYSLYWRVAIKQDFERQRVMYYAVQPIMGFILGAVIYFIIGAGFLVVNFATEPNTDLGAKTATVLSSQVVIALQVISGWIAGFRMRTVLELVDKIVQRFSPSRENLEAEEKESIVPPDVVNVIPPSDS